MRELHIKTGATSPWAVIGSSACTAK